MLNEQLLCPIVHKTNWNLCRVPVKREGDIYHVYVGDNFIRHYREDTLPDCIKEKLTMILALPNQIVPDEEVTPISIYNPHIENKDFDEIGWRASDSMFCVVMSYEDLSSLRGESIDRRMVVDDPRRKS